MSAGADNALKQWLFDAGDGAARLLRFRSGHAAPPAVVRFYGDAGTRLLSAGADAGRDACGCACLLQAGALHGAGSWPQPPQEPASGW